MTDLQVKVLTLANPVLQVWFWFWLGAKLSPFGWMFIPFVATAGFAMLFGGIFAFWELDEDVVSRWYQQRNNKNQD